MTDLIELAKQQAAEIARAGHNGWGNTMLALAAALEAAREDGWIACSDRLPGPSDHIEVFPNPDESTYNFYAHFNGGTNGVRAGNWYHNDRHGDNWIIRPTHWRPLSAPPALDQARGK